MSFPYMTALDSLVLETTEPTSLMKDEQLDADLALWTNAKFTYDVTPGQGILDDKPLDLDHFAQYLDMDIGSLQPAQPQTHEKATIAPTAIGLPTTINNNNNKTGRLLLPKPSTGDATTATTPTIPAVKPLSSKKRPAPELQDDDATPDDEKRRRNTAASARFRMKKKMKEQAMAQTVQEMTDKADALQNRVNELEIEVKFLRDLLLEKNKQP
ncbi:hypothetical protein BC940DRAFT_296444 [Gongronella butleri]|nr:hypothetical protein BC940DRAFT_296444 [Gongronella butleri]